MTTPSSARASARCSSRPSTSVDISESASIEQIGEMANGDAPDVVIIDPWRAGVDVGEIVGRLPAPR